MRKSETGPLLKLRAIGGLHVVALAWDFLPGVTTGRSDLLGFAIERTVFKPNGDVLERYWLRGIKRFQKKDDGVAPGTLLPTSEHPVQSFQWGDYTAKPDTKYAYRVVPAFGQPKLLELDEGRATTVTIRTEKEAGLSSQGDGPSHDIYFNRGAAGSQAYARRFGTQKPNPDHPDSEQMAWLSRGLFEALTRFIGLAAKADAARYKLRAMLYEFRYAPIGQAFKAARDAGADVDIRYEAQSYKDENEAMIAAVGIANICNPQKVRAGIRHNKFIVLMKDDVPIAVWTGSTNISAGGIFGHSNVGHIVRDQAIAQRYLDYWAQLASANVTSGKLKASNLALEATPAAGAQPAEDRIMTLFSPRDADNGNVPTLEWYGELVASAKRIACMTFAFNFDTIFFDALKEDGDSLNYLVFDKQPDDAQRDLVEKKGNTVIAVGEKLEKGALAGFLNETLTGLNRNLYIHDKFILVDPLGDDPTVVTGTANFSRASQVANDENMLVIRGNTRVSDIYFGEFMRVFDHLYARYIVKKLSELGPANPSAGFLYEKQSQWLPPHFKAGNRKALRRAYFVEG
jgi:phosphatidylserine/phosphatidylglycerophosphate/cardiolipin synthase-like enzyme